MDWVRATPKIIYSFWLQGEKEAPDIVRLCFDRWTTFNPNYELRVLDGNDVGRLLDGSNIPFKSMPVQALSDVIRARLLLNSGGVWVDSSLFPMRPLDTWLAEELQKTGFFAFERPGDDRPISSWFLTAARDHVIMKCWWEEIERFWSRPRRLTTYESGMIPNNPVAEVAPNGGAATDKFPYFWFHYLFQYMIDNNSDIANIWANCAKRSAGPPHRLQSLFAQTKRPGRFLGLFTQTKRFSRKEIYEAACCAPVQKLNWRANYPLSLFATL